MEERKRARAAEIEERKRAVEEARAARRAEVMASRGATDLADAKRSRMVAAQALDEDDDLPVGAGSAKPVVVAPPVPRTRARRRHWAVLLSFLLMVVAPTAISAWYLWTRAADRYVSVAGFSVRREDAGSAFELLGGMAELGAGSGSDTDILYEFIQGQELVAKVDAALDLRSLWSRPDPDVDPVFAYHPPGAIEDLTDYWQRMVGVYNDTGTGLISIQVQAFAPGDAQAIAQMIYDESTAMINRLSAESQADATRFSREELDLAVERLKAAREAVTRFRNRTQIVDPTASIQSQMGLLSSLEAQLAETLIDLDILRQTTSAEDPRIVAAERRVAVIETRMAEERRKLGIGTGVVPGEAGDDGNAFADLLGEYERLIVDLQFAEQAYTAALVTFDGTVAESRRQSRYLAAHIRPTLAESPDHPQREVLTALVAVFSFMIWAFLVLAGYALRDRR